jgi:hypothetical protein
MSVFVPGPLPVTSCELSGGTCKPCRGYSQVMKNRLTDASLYQIMEYLKFKSSEKRLWYSE